MQENKRFAILIDAENIPAVRMKEVFDEALNLGTLTTRRAYTDWSNPANRAWKKPLMKYAITAIQQFSNSKGKNSSDSALIIDAMDILYSGKADGFVIVSNDSDFTRLIVRLREAEKMVVGIGNKNAHEALFAACDRFISLDELSMPNKSSLGYIPQEVVDCIAECIAQSPNVNEKGFVPISDISTKIQDKIPDFDSKKYLGTKLSVMIKTVERFDLRWIRHDPKKPGRCYVRDKKATPNTPSAAILPIAAKEARPTKQDQPSRKRYPIIRFENIKDRDDIIFEQLAGISKAKFSDLADSLRDTFSPKGPKPKLCAEDMIFLTLAFVLNDGKKSEMAGVLAEAYSINDSSVYRIARRVEETQLLEKLDFRANSTSQTSHPSVFAR